MKYIFIVLSLLIFQNSCFAQCANCGSYSNTYSYSIQKTTSLVRNVSDQNLVKINNIELAEQNAKANNKTLLLVFIADWCKYCGPLKEQLQSNINMVNQKFVVCYVDFDKNKQLANKYNITSLPSSVFIKDNGERRTIIGFGNFSNYKRDLGL